MQLVDILQQQIDEMEAEIDKLIQPYQEEVKLLDTISGIDQRSAPTLTFSKQTLAWLLGWKYVPAITKAQVLKKG